MLSFLGNELHELRKAVLANTAAVQANTRQAIALEGTVLQNSQVVAKLTTALAIHGNDLDSNTEQLAHTADLLESLVPLLQKIVDQLNPEAVKFSIDLTDLDGNPVASGDSPMPVQLPDTTGPKLLTLTPRDAKGFPTTLDGAATFVSSDPTVATVANAGDLVGRIDFADTTPGKTVQIQFSGDAQLGDGVTQISGTLDIEFVAGQAATLEGALSDAV